MNRETVSRAVFIVFLRFGTSLREGNKDHFLSQAKSEIMRQEHQVGPSIIVPVSYSNMLMLKDWNYKTYNTDISNHDKNKFVYKKNYL